MRLTPEQFQTIVKGRNFTWTKKDVGGVMYNSLTNQTDTKLFWLAFFKLVFLPKFKTQKAVTRISEFDMSQPVLITDELQLSAPTMVDTVFYFADYAESPMSFRTGIPITTVFFGALVFFFMFILLSFFVPNRTKFRFI